MQQRIERIQQVIKAIGNLSSLSENTIKEKSLPNKWSKQEVIGHLCDSAINNITRFVNIQYIDAYQIQPYQQEAWVQAQKYHELPSQHVLTLFETLQTQIIFIISDLPSEELAKTCVIPNGETKTLDWLIEDYVSHLEHHLNNHIL